MSTPLLQGIQRSTNRFYSYPNFTTHKGEDAENTSINSQGIPQSYAELNHNDKKYKKTPIDVYGIKPQHKKPSSFYPIEDKAELKSNAQTVTSKTSRFSRFMQKFQSRIYKTTGRNNKFNTVTGANIAPPIDDHLSTTSWKRRFSRHHTSMFYPKEDKLLPLKLDSDKLTEKNLSDIFSPPVEEPMKTIDSCKDEAIVNPSTMFIDFDSFYKDTFFTTSVRKPTTYDNSQITDETIVV